MTAGSPKTVVILQSCYIPWKGFFDLVGHCDEFILFDDTQFTRRDWRSRNRIKTPQGPLWLTIPVASRGRFDQLIQDVTVADPSWAERHWQSIRHAYAKAPHFESQESWLKALFAAAGGETHLSRVNASFIRAISAFLGFSTRISWSRDYPGAATKTARLVDICRQAGATRYLSGPSARAYIEPALFADAGIELAYFSYDGYPEYPQLHGPFNHQVSIVDTIFSLGPDTVAALRRHVTSA